MAFAHYRLGELRRRGAASAAGSTPPPPPSATRPRPARAQRLVTRLGRPGARSWSGTAARLRTRRRPDRRRGASGREPPSAWPTATSPAPSAPSDRSGEHREGRRPAPGVHRARPAVAGHRTARAGSGGGRVWDLVCAATRCAAAARRRVRAARRIAFFYRNNCRTRSAKPRCTPPWPDARGRRSG